MNPRQGQTTSGGAASATSSPVTFFNDSAMSVTDSHSESVEATTAVIITTGGTIAGAADSATSTTYDSAQLSGEALLKQSIPDLDVIGLELEVNELFSVDSSDISIQHLLQLANTINETLRDPSKKGVVITHGTDTLEETAYFLNLVIKSDKPVVLVGSMRPSTSLSPDGPMNLFNALSIVKHDHAVGRGVMILMNDVILGARDATKGNTTEVNAFRAPNSGPIGKAHAGAIRFNSSVDRKHTVESKFDVTGVNELPEVEIIYEYLGSSGKQLRRAIHDENPPAGIVIAGTGDGNVPINDKALLTLAREKGIQIVRSSRVGSGEVTRDGVDGLDSGIGLVPGDNLNPQKARILLMLSIARVQKKKLRPNKPAMTEDDVTRKLNKYFRKY